MATELEAIQQALDEANDGLEAIGGFVAATATAADALVGRVADLPDAITVPLPRVDIPDFTIPIINQSIRLPEVDLGGGSLSIPIPGIAPIQQLAADLVEAGASVAEPDSPRAVVQDRDGFAGGAGRGLDGPRWRSGWRLASSQPPPTDWTG